MTASVHAIRSRHKDHPARGATLADFGLDAGQPADSNRVVRELGWSLYCLDQERRCAVFVQAPPETDLSATPFLRMAQFARATEVMLVPWAGLEDLAAQVPLVPNLVFVFSMGRSGTTLTSRMLDGIDGVRSLSEPSAQFDPTRLRAANGPALTRQLIASATRLLCRQPDGTRPQTLACKLYSQSLFNCLDYYAAFPRAKYVFLYRDGFGWANSMFKMFQSYGGAEILDAAGRKATWDITSGWNDIRLLDEVLPATGAVTHPEEVFAASWALHMETYCQALVAGVPFLALRYNDILADKDAGTRALLRHCGLPETGVAAALAGFDRDSQAGSGIGQDNAVQGLGPDARTRFEAALSRQPRFSASGMLLPDRYRP